MGFYAIIKNMHLKEILITGCGVISIILLDYQIIVLTVRKLYYVSDLVFKGASKNVYTIYNTINIFSGLLIISFELACALFLIIYILNEMLEN